MARIKIKDLPENQRVTREEMSQILGGTLVFESFDQKSNQLFNILSTVLKAQKEMQSSVTRNLL
jgi:hypothetical protein